MAKQERKDLRPRMRCACEMIAEKVTNNICAAHMQRFQAMHRQALGFSEISGIVGKSMTPKQQLEWVISHPNVTVRAVKPSGFVAFDTSEGLSTLAKTATYQEAIQIAAKKIA